MRVADLIKRYEFDNKKKKMLYSIDCYGYGTDHDADVLTKIAQQKKGNFYFIKELK